MDVEFDDPSFVARSRGDMEVPAGRTVAAVRSTLIAPARRYAMRTPRIACAFAAFAFAAASLAAAVALPTQLESRGGDMDALAAMATDALRSVEATIARTPGDVPRAFTLDVPADEPVLAPPRDLAQQPRSDARIKTHG